MNNSAIASADISGFWEHQQFLTLLLHLPWRNTSLHNVQHLKFELLHDCELQIEPVDLTTPMFAPVLSSNI